jgi:hypothetical protein
VGFLGFSIGAHFPNILEQFCELERLLVCTQIPFKPIHAPTGNAHDFHITGAYWMPKQKLK